MATTVRRPDPEHLRRWQALCDEHQTGLNSSKPSCIIWAEKHVKDEHPGEVAWIEQ